MRFTNKLLLGFVSLVIVFGCSEGAKDTMSDSEFTKIFNASFRTCKSCHDGVSETGTRSNLNMSDASSAHAGFMERVASPGSPSTCTNQFRVVAGQPSKSYLLGMLSATYMTADFNGQAGCAHPPTHKDGINLSQAELDAIIQWIQSGAAR